jgi:hypothetical protein
MFWTLELASYLEDAPWPATKDELIDYSIRSGAPIEVVEKPSGTGRRRRSIRKHRRYLAGLSYTGGFSVQR